MKLAELIKKQKEVVKIRENSKIAAAASTMTDEKIGALLVENDAGEIVGILSERDIVRGMGPHGLTGSACLHRGYSLLRCGWVPCNSCCFAGC